MKSLLCCFRRQGEEEAEVMTSSSSQKEQEELRDNPVVVDRWEVALKKLFNAVSSPRLPSLPLPPLRCLQTSPSPRMLGELQAFEFTEVSRFEV